mgnify:CR=1 FL=1
MTDACVIADQMIGAVGPVDRAHITPVKRLFKIALGLGHQDGNAGEIMQPADMIDMGVSLDHQADLIRAERLARESDLLIAAGSTLQVQPAASYPLLAKEAGAKLAIVTLSETPLDRYADFVFNEKLGSFLKRLETI